MATRAESALQHDLRRLAVGCLNLLKNKATLEFPTTSRAHPSYEVVVALATDPMRDGDRVYFPFAVPWGIWHDGIVPVLKNPDVQFYRNALNTALLGLNDYDALLGKLEEYLRLSFIRAGYLPPDPETAPTASEEPEGMGNGDPIRWPPVSPTMFHRDGTPKLTYQLVDVG